MIRHRPNQSEQGFRGLRLCRGMTAPQFDFEEDDVPKGYVGWANDVNKRIRWQLYQANVNENMMDSLDLYPPFMNGVKIQVLKLEARESLHGTFFSSRTTFFP